MDVSPELHRPDPAAGTGPDEAPAAATAVSLERVRRVLGEAGVPWFVDHEGDLGVLWRRGTLRLDVWHAGEAPALLLFSGSWHRRPHLERLPQLLEMVDAWNARAGAVKTFLRVLDDGHVLVCFESALLVSAGASDAQIVSFVQGSIGAALDRGAELAALYPDPLSLPEEP